MALLPFKPVSAACESAGFGGCYLKLDYPKYLFVTKLNGADGTPVNPLYAAKPPFQTEYLNDKVPNNPALENAGLVWYPKEAVGKQVDLIIALHGWRSFTLPKVNMWLKPPWQSEKQKNIEAIVRKHLNSGQSDPIVIAAPLYDKGPDETVWSRSDVYTTTGLINAIKATLDKEGANIDFKRVSVIGHSNANCGGGLARTAAELVGYNLYLYMAADGTCDGANGGFFEKNNVFDIVKKQGGILFHLHQAEKDKLAVAEIKAEEEGGDDPDAINKDRYLETWKSADGKIFTYRLQSGTGPYGGYGHTYVPNYLLDEVIPRFFGNESYDPNAHPPVAGTNNQNPAENASLWNDLSRSYNEKKLTDSELQKFLQKPVPKIKIPGLNFSDITLKNLEHTDENGTYLYFPFLGEYIKALYKYLIVIMAIVAVIMLIIAGLQWMLPGGEAENISAAKKRIEQAIVGLTIAITSYSILYTINPELVNFRNLRVRMIQPKQFELTAAYDDTAEDNYPVDTNIVKKLDLITEVTEGMFTPMQINDDKEKTDGWAIWNSGSLSDNQKTEILPYLLKQIAKCPIDEPNSGKLVDITGVPDWANNKIHADALAAFQNANKIANDLGFKLIPGSSFRDTDNLVTLWNTGVVGRYNQGIAEWKNNEDKISLPSCNAPHATGGAVDVNLYDNDEGKVVLDAADKSKIIAANYASKFLGDKYKIILEYIMNQAGWVRLCSEHWHFEYAVTNRYKAWEVAGKKSRCWLHTDSIEQPIPEEMNNIVNQTLKDKGKQEIFK